MATVTRPSFRSTYAHLVGTTEQVDANSPPPAKPGDGSIVVDQAKLESIAQNFELIGQLFRHGGAADWARGSVRVPGGDRLVTAHKLLTAFYQDVLAASLAQDLETMSATWFDEPEDDEDDQEEDFDDEPTNEAPTATTPAPRDAERTEQSEDEDERIFPKPRGAFAEVLASAVEWAERMSVASNGGKLPVRCLVEVAKETAPHIFNALDNVLCEAGATEEYRSDASGYVAIVDVPADWKPESVDDMPLNIDFRKRRSEQFAKVYAQGFNEARMAKPDGQWAVPVNVSSNATAEGVAQ